MTFLPPDPTFEGDPLSMLWLLMASRPVALWPIERRSVEGMDRYRRPWSYPRPAD